MNPNRRCTSSPPRLQWASGPGLPDIALAAAGEGGSFLHHPCLLLSAYSSIPRFLFPSPPAFAHPPRPTALFRPFSKQIKAIQTKHFPPSKTFVGIFVANFVEMQNSFHRWPPAFAVVSITPCPWSTARFSRIFKADQTNSKQTFSP
jgi:hypothetical protein